MELLNIVAQVVVLIGIFLWMVLKGIWSVFFVTWEITRDYTPIITKRVWILLKRGYSFSSKWCRKAIAWISAHTASGLHQMVFSIKTSLIYSSRVLNNLKISLANHTQGAFNRPELFSGLSAFAKKAKFLIPTKISVRLPKAHPKVFSKISLASMVVSFVVLFFIFFPDLVFAIIPYQTSPIESAVNQSALGGSFADGNLYSTLALPEKNEYLPDGNWLVIPKIGVLTQINEAPTETHEDALKNGVWRVPEFADPTAGKNYPTILVAHKFGYLVWSNKFRRQNSFNNLEKLEIGDTFDVIWDHRKFTYEIYAGEEGKEITDYKADMILYTCKYLNSPARIFRYARRVEY